MPFRDAELEMTVTNGIATCGTTTVYYDPPPRTNTYTIHASRDYESLNGGVPFPDRPFSTGAVVIDGGARKATLTFNSNYINTWHTNHFDQGRLVRIWMDLPGNLADEPLKVRLKCVTHGALSHRAFSFATFNMALAALAVHQTVEAAKAVGSSEGAPSRRFSRRPVIASALAYPLRMLFRR